MSINIGSMSAKAIIGALFALALGVIFAVNLVAPQITGIFTTNTTEWDTGTTALWVLLALVVVAVIVFLFLRVGGIVAYTAFGLAFANAMVMIHNAGAVIVQLI